MALIDNYTDFAAAAKQYSAAATRDQGGKLGWLPINRLPEPLRPVLLGLEPGETSSVIPMQGALAIFQMRSIAETAYRAPTIAAVEYAAYRLPGGRTPENLPKRLRLPANWTLVMTFTAPTSACRKSC
ncbi:peptidylprolyl isomerase [Thalassobius sp. MITS945101]|uniref:peptidylprolyl isomerase n=1 Tax=Thalassobius sp. MITS945101 TaxID=3096994 RepID=UPI00399AB8DC